MKYDPKKTHPFYQKLKRAQQIIQLKVVGIALLIFIVSFIIAWQAKTLFIAFLAFFLLMTIIAPFIDLPSSQQNGKLIYYSNFLITEKEKKGVVKIHGGTLLDYYFVLHFKWSGQQRTHYILQQYLEGLLNLIEAYENGEFNQVKFTGTTYILSARTAKKLGFKIIKIDGIQLLLLFMNYFNLLVSNSIAKRKLAFPNLRNALSFEAELPELIKKKQLIKALSERLKEH